MASITQSLTASNRLDAWLAGLGYPADRRSAIRHDLWRHGELVSSVESGHLHPYDEEYAESVFVNALDEASMDDPSWDDDGTWSTGCRIEPDWLSTATLTADDVLPALDGDEPDGTPDEHITREPGYRESLERDGITLMPISGGSPEFTPSDEDWQDYRRHFDELDRLDAEPRYGYE